jgi:hypothetical protein
MRVHILRAFITYLLVPIHQKEKIALEIATKIASVNRPLEHQLGSLNMRLQIPLESTS